MNTALMERLARRGGFAKRFGVEYVDGPWPHLNVGSPSGVARVVGEAKRDAYPGRVFVRGQASHHNAMLPSVFRRAAADTACLRSAETEFVAKVRERIKVRRFQAANTAALLQHYGFRTTWLDAVDNLFVAYWFAEHELSANAEGFLKICKSGESWGWLFLLHPPIMARVVDLRTEHHPLSARPHVQHGVSLTDQPDADPDLREWVVATVRTPVADSTGGTLFTASCLFPPGSGDHTLRLLLKHKVNELAAAVEQGHGLALETLGRTSQYEDAA